MSAGRPHRGPGARLCEVHSQRFEHRPPVACTPDWHHLLPRDWQRAWTPPSATVVTTAAYGAVWEPAGVWAPPTCHHNVHMGIVTLTKALQPDDTPHSVADRVLHRRVRPHLEPEEWASALRALELWTERGGELAFLVKTGLWGAA